MKEILLLKDGEIVLKGLNRRSFEDVLKKNLKHALKVQAILRLHPHSPQFM